MSDERGGISTMTSQLSAVTHPTVSLNLRSRDAIIHGGMIG